MKDGKFSVVIDGTKFSCTISSTKNGNENGKPAESKPNKDS